MLPQEAVGALIPSPKKLKPASARMVWPTYWVIITMIGEMLLGRMCLNISLKFLLP